MDMDKFFAAIRAQRQKQETESTGEMFLIAGLGNPGREYRESRHNFGFMVIDRLAERLNVEFNKEQQKALVTTAPYEGRRLLLVKPLTYMNESGRAVVPLLRYYKIPQDHLFVIHDDMDLPLGTIRIRKNGSSGGHNGIKSIISKLSHFFNNSASAQTYVSLAYIESFSAYNFEKLCNMAGNFCYTYVYEDDLWQLLGKDGYILKSFFLCFL